MQSVVIYGAGSIGNHLAHACRNNNWDVSICDIDPAALERTKNDIYPSRYGSWDPEIKLFTNNELPKKAYDLAIIGTPPDTHIKLAMSVLRENSPKLMLIEKPLCTPSLEGCDELYSEAKKVGTHVFVAYNHTTTTNTVFAEKFIRENKLGVPKTLNVQWLEHWGGIFAAHPWLAGPSDSYLGKTERGGGALNEHSHCVNIWQHFSHVVNMGRVSEVTATMKTITGDGVDYDEVSVLGLKSEKGLVGNVITDVVSNPPVKTIRVQGDKGHVEWFCNYSNGNDAVLSKTEGESEVQEKLIPKTRPDDFQNEINMLGNVLDGSLEASECPTYIERGLETMLVLAAAHKSSETGKTVKINYENGYNLSSLN